MRNSIQLVLLLASAVGCCSWVRAGDISVLTLGAENDVQVEQDVLNSIVTGDSRFNAGASAAYDYYASGDPTLGYLSQFNSILFWSDYSPTTTILDELAQYVDGGGHVVIGTFVGQEGFPTGILGPGYSPLVNPTFDAYTPASLGAYDPSNPIFSGVNSIYASDYRGDYQSGLDSGATLVASWDDGKPFVAVNSQGNVIDVTLFPGLLAPRFSYATSSGDIAHLLANALAYDAQSNTSPVPEPSSMALAGLGGLGLLIGAYRRRNTVR